MRHPKLSKLEMQIMEVLWEKGPTAIRDIQESFGPKLRPAYTTVQTMVYRLEAKKALRRARTDASSYWIARDPPGPVAGSLKDQF